MVQYHPETRPRRLDAVFGALADPTRRAVLARLERGERTVGDLARPFAMSLTGFLKHLHILEDAGLIARQKEGRVVSCRLAPGALNEARAWLDRHEAFWNARLDRLGTHLERKEHVTWPPQSTTTPGSRSAGPTTRRSTSSTPRGRTRRK
ncbi:MAG: metalloregulator ArsR/SmtB family transcription factor [Burkholderiales bacterium]